MDSEYVSGLAHLFRFGGALIAVIVTIYGLISSFSSRELFIISAWIMFSGITIEAIYHFIEGELLA